MCDWSPPCPARNWRFAVVGAGFEEVELLDAVDYGGPQRSSCGPVSRRVRLGWRSLPSTERALIGSGPAPIRAGEGLRAPVAMVVAPRPER